MAVTRSEESKVTRMPDREPLATKLARLEEGVQDLAGDVSDIKTQQMGMVDMLDKRMRMLEEVRVRALEDWRLAEKVREEERYKQADREELVQHQLVSRRQFWIGTIAIVVATILAALIASGHI